MTTLAAFTPLTENGHANLGHGAENIAGIDAIVWTGESA